jgi:hypothetical protein
VRPETQLPPRLLLITADDRVDQVVLAVRRVGGKLAVPFSRHRGRLRSQREDREGKAMGTKPTDTTESGLLLCERQPQSCAEKPSRRGFICRRRRLMCAGYP